MIIVIWLLLCVILIVPYVVFFARRGSVKGMPTNWGLDSVSFLATAFAGVALSLLLSWEMALHPSSLWILPVAIPVLLIGVMLLFLPRKVLVGVMRPKTAVDERVAAISAKSARNALTATYLALVVLLARKGDTLDRNSVVILLGSGLLVFYASYVFYFYRKS